MNEGVLGNLWDEDCSVWRLSENASLHVRGECWSDRIMRLWPRLHRGQIHINKVFNRGSVIQNITNVCWWHTHNINEENIPHVQYTEEGTYSRKFQPKKSSQVYHLFFMDFTNRHTTWKQKRGLWYHPIIVNRAEPPQIISGPGMQGDVIDGK